jgi:membrane-bound serine protease (ClpP class)
MTVALVIGLMVAGLALIAIEVFVIPGFGVIGILGIGCAIGSAYLAYAELETPYSAIAIAGGIVGAGVVFWFVPRTKVGKSMVLKTQTLGRAANPELAALLEREGNALTPLRPSGSVEIDDRPVDVVTDGEYVEAGTRVRVVRVEGGRVVVERVD